MVYQKIKRLCGGLADRAWVRYGSGCVIDEVKTDSTKLKEYLCEYDVISFDIFDTLIERYTERPTDLFYIVGDRLGIHDFHDIRIEAECNARSEKYKLYKSTEVNIHDIYESLTQMVDIDAEASIMTEFETECDYCYANPYMRDLYEHIKLAGKTVIIVSDMYIPSDYMVELLHSCCYSCWDRLYVSCDYNCNKYTGSLYKKISSQIGADKKIFHIGDNVHSDVISAERSGWNAGYYIGRR